MPGEVTAETNTEVNLNTSSDVQSDSNIKKPNLIVTVPLTDSIKDQVNNAPENITFTQAQYLELARIINQHCEVSPDYRFVDMLDYFIIIILQTPGNDIAEKIDAVLKNLTAEIKNIDYKAFIKQVSFYFHIIKVFQDDPLFDTAKFIHLITHTNDCKKYLAEHSEIESTQLLPTTLYQNLIGYFQSQPWIQQLKKIHKPYKDKIEFIAFTEGTYQLFKQSNKLPEEQTDRTGVYLTFLENTIKNAHECYLLFKNNFVSDIGFLEFLQQAKDYKSEQAINYDEIFNPELWSQFTPETAKRFNWHYLSLDTEKSLPELVMGYIHHKQQNKFTNQLLTEESYINFYFDTLDIESVDIESTEIKDCYKRYQEFYYDTETSLEKFLATQRALYLKRCEQWRSKILSFKDYLHTCPWYGSPHAKHPFFTRGIGMTEHPQNSCVPDTIQARQLRN